jgi:hypothetical protein
MERKLQLQLNLVMPDIAIKIQEKQIKQKNHNDMHTKQRHFETGDED